MISSVSILIFYIILPHECPVHIFRMEFIVFLWTHIFHYLITCGGTYRYIYVISTVVCVDEVVCFAGTRM
jgi:hypothetical protein